MDLARLPAQKEGATHVVVESPRGSTVKIEYEPDLGAFTLARPLVLGVSYPYDWGFVPSTRGPDGDPLDALVIWDVASVTGLVLPCRLLGVVTADQARKDGRGRQRNDRILAVPVDAPRESVRSAEDLSKRVLEEVCHFFVTATAFEGKDVRILGVEGPRAADALVRSSLVEGAR